MGIHSLFLGPTILIQHSFPKSNTRTLVYTLFLSSTILFQHEDVGTHVHSFPGSNKINATLFSYVQQGKFKGCRVKLNLKRSVRLSLLDLRKACIYTHSRAAQFNPQCTSMIIKNILRKSSQILSLSFHSARSESGCNSDIVRVYVTGLPPSPRSVAPKFSTLPARTAPGLRWVWTQVKTRHRDAWTTNELTTENKGATDLTPKL